MRDSLPPVVTGSCASAEMMVQHTQAKFPLDTGALCKWSGAGRSEGSLENKERDLIWILQRDLGERGVVSKWVTIRVSSSANMTITRRFHLLLMFVCASLSLGCVYEMHL